METLNISVSDYYAREPHFYPMAFTTEMILYSMCLAAIKKSPDYTHPPVELEPTWTIRTLPYWETRDCPMASPLWNFGAVSCSATTDPNPLFSKENP